MKASKPLVFLAGAILGASFACACLTVVILRAIDELNRSSQAFVERVVPSVFEKWSVEELAATSSHEFISHNPASEIERMFDALSGLGGLVTYNIVSGGAYIAYDKPNGIMLMGSYIISGDFANGEAKIHLALQYQSGGWRIANFSVNTDLQ